MKTNHSILITAAACLSLAACNTKEASQEAATDKAASPQLIAVIDASVTGEAQAIHVLRESAKPGDEVTVKGWVMGHVSPFVDGRAAFMLGDPEVITACSEMPDDHCETPWDACCDSKEDKLRGTATIQVVNDKGRVLKESIEGVGGVENLAKLLITGIVAEGSSVDNLVINATAIDIQP